MFDERFVVLDFRSSQFGVLWIFCRFVVGKTCGGLLDDAWSNNQLSFVFLASSKIDTDLERRGIVANGIACPLLLMPSEGSCW